MFKLILQKLKQNSDATTSKMPHTHTIKKLEDLEPRSYWNNSNIYIYMTIQKRNTCSHKKKISFNGSKL